MTDEEKRVKIAEACGLVEPKFVMYHQSPQGGGLAAVCSKVPHSYHKDDFEWKPVPDYLNSLDAMHEAENTLQAGPCFAYHKHLRSIRRKEFLDNQNGAIIEHCAGTFDWHATARQRAEAFGRTMNLW